MNLAQLSQVRRQYLDKVLVYQMTYWEDFRYKLLDNIIYRSKPGRGDNASVNDIIIMADTETSKKQHNRTLKAKDGTLKYVQVDNHVVAWTISLRAFDRNLVTLWGRTPSDFVKCLVKIIGNMNGFETYVYFHNLSYDIVFLRKFLFREFGFPSKQLNVKSHYPIVMKWDNGLILKDSYILAQRSLAKWAEDLNVDHQKAVGLWDYDKIRSQREEFTTDELTYIEHDTLAGVECIDTLRQILGKSIFSMPYTATGIPREEVRKIGSEHRARDKFKRMVLSFEQYIKAEYCYHGGYTHANRHYIDIYISQVVKCFDFASSYPFVMLSEKFPMEKFSHISDKPIEYIIDNAENYAFMFKLILIKPRLKNDDMPMPYLQFSKCVKTINAVQDNGRILCAEYVEIYITEQDAIILNEQYDYDYQICCDIDVARKDYLPRWFTDYIFELFRQKTILKGGDPVLYALAKAKLNSLYGMCVQKNIKDDIVEDYITGEFAELHSDPQELYEKYIKKPNVILPYQWGVWVTAYATRNLFLLGKCVKTWLYSDTDSCYGIDWNMKKLEQYNENCKKKLQVNGYGCVLHKGREYWLGVAEHEPDKDTYSEYKMMGAKRYCGRNAETGELKITVAGVPKSGKKCLKNDINNFTVDCIFDGLTTGKLTHTYHYVDEIYIDEDGNETGDSIDLTPCDYRLDSVDVVDWEELFKEEIEVVCYEEDTKIL